MHRSASSRPAALAAALSMLALAACSRSEPAAPPAPAAPADAFALQMTAGRAVYTKVCATCHQANGQGVPGVFPPLAGSSIITATDPGKIIRATLHGLQGPIEVNGQTYNSVMPPQGATLKDDELAAALTYARNSWGNRAPAVTTDEVTVVRLTVKRDTFWTWAELNQP